MECLTSKQRVTQITVGVDGLAVVMAKSLGEKGDEEQDLRMLTWTCLD